MQWKIDMRFGAWDVMNLCRSGSLTAAAREWARYRLDLVGVQEFRWDKGGTERAGAYICYMEKGNHQLGTGFFVHQRIVSAVERVEFVSDRMSYIILRGSWCNIIVLNVRAPSEEKNDDSKGNRFLIIFLNTTRKLCSEILVENWG
jgi:hypothetical protein